MDISKLEHIVKSCYEETISTFNKWNLYHPEKLHKCDLSGVFKSYLTNKIRATFYQGETRRYFIEDMRKIAISVEINNNKLFVYCTGKYGNTTNFSYQWDSYFSKYNGQYDIFQTPYVEQETQTNFQTIINHLNNYKF